MLLEARAAKNQGAAFGESYAPADVGVVGGSVVGSDALLLVEVR